MHKTEPTSLYDVALLRTDMTEKGWLPIDLARHARVSHMTVSRFLSGERQTPRTAKKLATAIGRSVKRYLLASREAVDLPSPPNLERGGVR